MRFLPVAMREALLVSRSRASYHWRWGIVALGLASILYALAQSPPDAAGKNIFTILSTEAFIFCAVAGALLTADSLASEKRQETLGLLLLTPLRPFDVLAGKVVAATGKSFFGVLAFLPMIALPILIGGVESLQYAIVAINLLVTLFLSLSVGILISSVFKSSIVTTTLGFLAPAAFVFGPFGLMIALEAVCNFDPPVYWASPFFPHALALNTFGIEGTLRDVMCSIALIHLWGWINLFLAAEILKRSCTNVPTVRAEKRSQMVRKIRFGGERARAKLRTLLLDQNPLAWLANREQVSSSGLMAILLFVFFAAVALEFRHGEEYFVPNLFQEWPLILLTMHAILIFRMVTAACSQLAEDRRTGALELLLSTKLTVKEILRGRSQALIRQFFGPIAIVSFCHLCALILLAIQISVEGYPEPWESSHGFTLFVWIGLGAIFAMAWRTITFAGAWNGLRRRNSAIAALVTFRSILGPPFAVAFVMYCMMAAMGLPYGSERQFFESLMVIAGIFTAGYLFTLGNWARVNLETNFRRAALA